MAVGEELRACTNDVLKESITAVACVGQGYTRETHHNPLPTSQYTDFTIDFPSYILSLQYCILTSLCI